MELSDKAKLEFIDLRISADTSSMYAYEDHDVFGEMPELAECLSALQSACRSSTNGVKLYLGTFRELAALMDVGNSKGIEWDIVTFLEGYIREKDKEEV